MNERRFLNQQQPQTLVIATLLLYLNGFFNGFRGLSWGLPVLVAVAAAMMAGGFGIANEKKWGYGLAVAGAVINVLLLFTLYVRVDFLSLIFDVALVLLLVHPMSRDYQRIWFN
ncbi:MAG: hypothetical protein R3A49_01960 [Acidimicrobiia bacterium]